MDTLCLILEKDLSKGVGRAVREFKYPSKEEFILEAIREKVKNSKFDREMNNTWHALLSRHEQTSPKKQDFLYRPAFGLRDLLKHQM